MTASPIPIIIWVPTIAFSTVPTEKVAEDVGFIETAKDHTFNDFTLADYGFKGFESARLSVGLAGLIGVAATALFAMGLFFLIRRKAPTQKSIR